MSVQLTLPIGLRDNISFDNFYAGQNAEVIQALKQQWTTAGESFLYLWGSQSSGRTHLLQAACHYADLLGHHCAYLALDEVITYGPSVLEGLENLPLVVLDNLDTIAGNEQWEEALFGLYNQIHDRQSLLVVAASLPAKQLPFKLADLVSRLNWGVIYQVKPLNDEEKANALRLRAKQRGFDISEDVARYTLTHGPRDMRRLFEFLEKLDQASLTEQRKPTLQFVKAQLLAEK
ncbi:MAG: DnaA regulatory inactivator Hda [Venatoribacter sp.]